MEKAPPDDRGGRRPAQSPDGQGRPGGQGREMTRMLPVNGGSDFLGGPHQTDTERKGERTEVTGSLGERDSATETSRDSAAAQGIGTKASSTRDGAPAAAAPGGSYAEVVRGEHTEMHGGNSALSITKIAGRRKPRELHALLRTLAQDWTTATVPEDKPRARLMREAAMAESLVHQDGALRQRTEIETEALLAYLNGSLELIHAPNFLKATMTVIQRAMLEQFHETHIEASLTAVIAPRAKLRKSMTHIALFALLYEANADSPKGRAMIDRMLDDVKMLHFDGIHTLKFVFHSKRLARKYSGTALRLQGTCIDLEDTEDSVMAGVLRPAQLRRQYAVNVYGVDAIGLVVFIAAVSKLPGVHVADAERPRIDSTEVIDNRHVVIKFWGLECPAGLRGVTKLDIAGRLLTLHHHLIYPRPPCARCYAPFHTVGFCKASYALQMKAQKKYKRTYSGTVSHFDVGEAVQYCHTDGDSLQSFLQTLQEEVTAEMEQTTEAEPAAHTAEVISAGTSNTDDTRHVEGGDGSRGEYVRRGATRGPIQTAPSHNSSRGLATEAAEEPPLSRETADPITDQQRARAGHLLTEAPERGGGSSMKSDTGRGKGRKTDEIQSAVAEQDATNGTIKAKKRQYAKAAKQGFAAFNRDRARGRYSAIADDDSSSDESSQGDEDDEADYAYPSTVRADTPGSGLENSAVYDGAEAGKRPDLMDIGDEGDADTEQSVGLHYEPNSGDSQGYVGSSQPSQTQSTPLTPGSDFPFSMASSADVDEKKMAEPSEEECEDVQMAEISEAPDVRDYESKLSQDGLVYDGTKVAPGMPQQLPVFTMPFQGHRIHVPANGQCAYAALYASTSFVNGDKLKFTSEVVRDINKMKRAIYTLMMANLASDVECNLVEPQEELAKLYPKAPAPCDIEAATKALYAHYAQERTRTVNSQVPAEFWAGAEVLRAMAQYLREAIFVFDVKANQDTLVQRYYYKEYSLKGGDTHESGCGGAMDTTQAKIMLGHYERLHVMPIMLVLQRNEAHFYGMQHDGLTTKWQAEGDTAFARKYCTEHEWCEEVVAHNDWSLQHFDGADHMDDSDLTNELLIGSIDWRQRLDIIHERLQLPILSAVPKDIALLEEGLARTARHAQEAVGSPHAREGTEGSLTVSLTDGVNARYPISNHGHVALPVFRNILDCIGGNRSCCQTVSK